MLLRYFAAITPSAEITQRVETFVEKEIPEYLRSRTAPHIKIKNQIGLDATLDWLPIIEQVASETKPFEIHFNKPQMLGEHLLVLPALAPQIEEMHEKLVKLLMPPLEEDELYFEQESAFSPYLTLALGHFDPSMLSRWQLVRKAAKALENLGSFTATEITLYEAVIIGASYEPVRTIPLGKPLEGNQFSPVSSPAPKTA